MIPCSRILTVSIWIFFALPGCGGAGKPDPDAGADAADADGGAEDAGPDAGDATADGDGLDAGDLGDGDGGPGPCPASLANLDFESTIGPDDTAPPGWGLWLGTSAPDHGSWALDELAAEGQHSLRVTAAAGASFSVGRKLYLYDDGQPGPRTVSLSAAMRYEQMQMGTPPVLAVVRFLPGGAFEFLATLSAPGPSGSWGRVDGQFDLDGLPADLDLIFSVGGNPDDDAATAWCDDVRVDVDPCALARACPLVDPDTTPVSRQDAVAAYTKFDPADDVVPPILHDQFRYDPTDNPGGEWLDPQPLDLGGPINTAGAEDSFFFAADDDTTAYLWFTPSFQPDAPPQVLLPEEGIYQVSREKVGDDWVWGEPHKVWLFDTVAGEGCAFVEGDRMLFCGFACGFGDGGIMQFESLRVDGRWGMASPAGAPFDDPTYKIGEYHLVTDARGEWIYYHARDLAGGQGDLDLWVTRKQNGVWGPPVNLGLQFNTPRDEGFPYLTPDGSELWFTAYTRDPGYPSLALAIFRATRAGFDEANGVWLWNDPEEVITQYAGELAMDAERNLYFTHHFDDGTGQLVESDIYVARHK